MTDPLAQFNRRDVLGMAVASGAASAFASITAQPKSAAAAGDDQEDESATLRIVDTNVSLFQWPFRRLPLDETDALVKKLRSLGVTRAWAGSFEGLLHRDVAGVNSRLADACQAHPELVPIGSINLELPDWEHDFRQCVDVHRMPGVRVHPNYHGYRLDDDRFVRLLKLAAEGERLVQIATAMEDTRTQHPLVQMPDVDLSPLPAVMTNVPGARVQLLNHRLHGPLLDDLAKLPGMFFDTARVEGTTGVPDLIKTVPTGRVLFGSHAPFLIPEAALIRVHESGRLGDDELRAVLAENARQLMEPSAQES